jgi:hypothetical protein
MITRETEGRRGCGDKNGWMVKLKGVKEKHFSHFLRGADHKKLSIFSQAPFQLRKNLFARNYIKSNG